MLASISTHALIRFASATFRRVAILVAIATGLIAVAGAQEIDRQKEYLLAKALTAFNAQRFDEAEKLFTEVAKADPENYIPLEYLVTLREKEKDLKGALAWSIKARQFAPFGHWASLDYNAGHYAWETGDLSGAADLYRAVLTDVEHYNTVTATEYSILANYMLGFLYYEGRQYRLAEEYFHEAKGKFVELREAKAKAQPKTDLTEILPAKSAIDERTTLQAIHFYLGEIYARSGYARYSSAMLRAAEYGESREVRLAAWRIHTEVNQSRYYLSLGTAAEFDNNAAVEQLYSDVAVSTKGGLMYSTLFNASAGWQSSPTQTISYGVDFGGLLGKPVTAANPENGKLITAFGAWVDVWNRKNSSATLRYEFSNLFVNASAFGMFEAAHGPRLTLSYFPDQRWIWELGAFYRKNTFFVPLGTEGALYDSGARSGAAYGATARATLRGLNPILKPTMAYSFEENDTDGRLYTYRMNALSGGLDFEFGERIRISSGLGFAYFHFPLMGGARADSMVRAGANGSYALDSNWFLTLDWSTILVQSKDVEFTYGRYRFAGGIRYLF